MPGDEEQQSSNGSMDAEEIATLWQPLEVTSDQKPPGRCGHAALSCADGKRLAIIGGYNAEEILDDVWAFDLEKQEWAKADITGLSPPPRAFFRGCDGPPLAGEEQGSSGFAYVFGGSDIEGIASNDVWCLDIEDMVWRQVHEGCSAAYESRTAAPCPRTNHAMCRVGDDLAIHDGESSSGALLNDLWLFNPYTATWHEVRTFRTGPQPCARSSHCLAFAGSYGEDSAPKAQLLPSQYSHKHRLNGSLVVFGGLGNGSGAVPDSGTSPKDSMLLNDLWVLSPLSTSSCGIGPGEEVGATASAIVSNPALPVWSLVTLNGVGPSPRSLSAIVTRRLWSPSSDKYFSRGEYERAEIFIFGGYGLVELPSDCMESAGDGSDSGEGGDIVMAYIDDLWGLSMQVDRDEAVTVADGQVEENNDTLKVIKSKGAFVPTGGEWVDEPGMGFAGSSPVEGRNGHTLTWCGEKLVLFGGFVGDGFDAGVHIAETPSLAALESGTSQY